MMLSTLMTKHHILKPVPNLLWGVTWTIEGGFGLLQLLDTAARHLRMSRLAPCRQGCCMAMALSAPWPKCPFEFSFEGHAPQSLSALCAPSHHSNPVMSQYKLAAHDSFAAIGLCAKGILP